VSKVEIADLPVVNACLNATSTVLLLIGYRFIRTGRRVAHKRTMLSALVTSSLFLISYLVYHYNVGSVRFTGTGVIRGVYFAILVSHTILAATVPPLAIVTLVRALRERFDKHRRIARWTLPIWLYVSITGVAVYVMLYRLYPLT
jgi:putative membrane protein